MRPETTDVWDFWKSRTLTAGTWNPGFTEPLGLLHSETTTLAPGDAALPISGGQSSIAG